MAVDVNDETGISFEVYRSDYDLDTEFGKKEGIAAELPVHPFACVQILTSSFGSGKLAAVCLICKMQGSVGGMYFNAG